MKTLTIPELEHLLKDQLKAVTATRRRLTYLKNLAKARAERQKEYALAKRKGLVPARRPCESLSLEERQRIQAKFFAEEKTLKPHLKTE